MLPPGPDGLGDPTVAIEHSIVPQRITTVWNRDRGPNAKFRFGARAHAFRPRDDRSENRHAETPGHANCLARVFETFSAGRGDDDRCVGFAERSGRRRAGPGRTVQQCDAPMGTNGVDRCWQVEVVERAWRRDDLDAAFVPQDRRRFRVVGVRWQIGQRRLSIDVGHAVEVGHPSVEVDRTSPRPTFREYAGKCERGRRLATATFATDDGDHTGSGRELVFERVAGPASRPPDWLTPAAF
ncbi:hypothetical protein GCM10028857_09550 [Salinarchaeum chitinilyticum]